MPVSYRDRTIWHAATPADTMPRSDWWVAFHEPDLDRLQGELLARNFTLASAAATYDQARANAAAARSGLFPQVNAGAEISYNRQSEHRPLRSPNQPTYYGANTVGAAVGYEVDLWDQIHNQVVAGKVSAQASAADLAFIRLSLQAELANDYLLLRGLDAQEKLLDNTVTAYRHALDVVQNRFRGLIASGVDVSRAQTELEFGARPARRHPRAARAGGACDRDPGQRSRARLLAAARPVGDPHAAAAAGHSLGAAAAPPRHRRRRASGGRGQCRHRRRARGLLSEHLAQRARRLPVDGAEHASTCRTASGRSAPA